MTTNKKNLVEIPEGRIEMKRDQVGIDKFLASAEDIGGLLNSALDAFSTLGIGEITLTEIHGLLFGSNTVENFVRERVSGGKSVKISGLVFSAEKVKSMVEIPDTSLFEIALSNIKEGFKKRQNEYGARITDFEIVDGKAQLLEEKRAQVIEQGTQFAETEAEKETFLIMQDVVEKLAYLQTKYKFHALDFNPLPLVRQTRGIHTHPATTEFNIHLIKSFFKPVPKHWR